jgi:hypothetical protein
MRENRPCGSEGGESQTLPDPYQGDVEFVARPPEGCLWHGIGSRGYKSAVRLEPIASASRR